MIFVLHIEGKREDLDRIMIKTFDCPGEAQAYCDSVNVKAMDKYFKYAEIVEADKLYEPTIQFEFKSIK